MVSPPVGDHHPATVGQAHLGRRQLGHHAALAIAGGRLAGHGLDLGRDLGDLGDDGGVLMVAGIGGIEAVDVRQQNQGVGADHRRHPGRQAVVVAETDFVGGDRVVFVD